MKVRNLPQILVLALALAISLYFWLGIYAIIVYVLVVAVVLTLYFWPRMLTVKRKVDRQPSSPQVVVEEMSKQIVERRKEQGRLLLSVCEQIKSLKPEYNRLVERLLDWYLEYLRDDGIYHQDPNQFLLSRIKERRKEAKAQYFKRELEMSRIIVRAIMRGEDASAIVERLESDVYDVSQ